MVNCFGSKDYSGSWVLLNGSRDIEGGFAGGVGALLMKEGRSFLVAGVGPTKRRTRAGSAERASLGRAAAAVAVTVATRFKYFKYYRIYADAKLGKGYIFVVSESRVEVNAAVANTTQAEAPARSFEVRAGGVGSCGGSCCVLGGVGLGAQDEPCFSNQTPEVELDPNKKTVFSFEGNIKD